eukprot:3163718-Pyramimonas_sp.AAC.1
MVRLAWPVPSVPVSNRDPRVSLRGSDMQPFNCSAYWLEHTWHRLCSVWFSSSGAGMCKQS